MECTFEPSTLLGPGATVLALLVALTAFLALRMVDRHRSIQGRLEKEDIPDQLRRFRWFQWSNYLELALYVGFIGYVVLVAIWTVNLLTGVIHYYLVDPPTTALGAIDVLADCAARDALATEFSNLVLYRLSVLFLGLLVVVLIELVPSIPWLPVTIAWFYWRASRGTAVGSGSAEKMFERAKKSLQKGDSHSATLLGGTAIEFFLRSILDVGSSATWSEIATNLRRRLEDEGRPESGVKDILGTVKVTRNLRNKAAHPVPDAQITLDEAKQLISSGEWLMKELR